MALAAGVLAIEIFLLPPRKSYIYLALAEIILLSLVLIWTPQTTFPSLLGMDTFSHGELTSQTLVNGRLPPGERYSSFPIMHLTAGTTMLVANLDYKLATMVSLCVAYVVVVLLFVFLVGRLAASNRVGLTAALLLSLIPSYIHSGWWMAPNFYAPVFMLGIVYLLFQGKTRHPVRLTLLSIFLMTALIITHEIATLALAIALGFFWLAQKPYERIYRVGYGKFATLALCLFFGAAMFSWWKYTSPTTINTLQRLMHYHLSAELWYQPVEQSRQYTATIPFSEHLLRNLAEPLFYAISFIGCLAAFSWRWGNRHIFLLAITGLALLSIGFFSLTFEFGTLPNRWQFVSLFWLAIPAAIGLFLLGRGEGEDSRGALLAFLLVGGLSFLSIASPMSNIDNPILSKNATVRYAFKQSELQAAASISHLWETKVVTDDYYYLAGYHKLPGVPVLTNDFISGDFSRRKDTLVVIRKEIAERPFHLPGIFKLSYDPRQVLNREGFCKIYDCTTVDAFVQNIEKEAK